MRLSRNWIVTCTKVDLCVIRIEGFLPVAPFDNITYTGDPASLLLVVCVSWSIYLYLGHRPMMMKAAPNGPYLFSVNNSTNSRAAASSFLYFLDHIQS